MDYISTGEAAQKWGVSLRYVQRLLKENRIPEVKKYSGAWLIPAHAERPKDLRRAPRSGGTQKNYRLLPLMNFPKNGPDGVAETAPEEYRGLVCADLAYRRGDTEPAKKY